MRISLLNLAGPSGWEADDLARIRSDLEHDGHDVSLRSARGAEQLLDAGREIRAEGPDFIILMGHGDDAPSDGPDRLARIASGTSPFLDYYTLGDTLRASVDIPKLLIVCQGCNPDSALALVSPGVPLVANLHPINGAQARAFVSEFVRGLPTGRPELDLARDVCRKCTGDWQVRTAIAVEPD